MNDFSDTGEPSDNRLSNLNMEDSSWMDKAPTTPISPLSFAFMNQEQRNAFNFPANSLNVSDPDKTEAEPYSSPNKKNTLKVQDLVVVDDPESSMSSGDGYEPKAHLGWASFGESIKDSIEKAVQVEKETGQAKRKVYVIRNREKARPYQILNPVASRHCKTKTQTPTPSKSNTSDSDEVDEEIVDVVGVEEEDEAYKKAVENGKPPDLPPQQPLRSRFEMQRQRKDFYRRGYCSEEDADMSKVVRDASPPPRLEPQTVEEMECEEVAEKDSDREDEEGEQDGEDGDRIEKKLKIPDHNPSQLLKTKISSSTIPILPLSKSIMERQRVAIEMTKNAVIKRIPPPKNASKPLTFAPKSVRVPAYAEKAPITLYSKFNKTNALVNSSFTRDSFRTGCARCREQNHVDMSSFKFMKDSNVVAVRAHLCDQTRVMIARTAMWNREYAKRLGERAIGTIWHKPDEVTAQMTGFCSATVRRCIDIASLSIVPKCADRVGVSKNELSSLKTAFGNEKFCGQTMRTPHVLTQYYSVKSAPVKKLTPTVKIETERSPEQLKRDEEERKHHPLAHLKTPLPLVPANPQPISVQKKTVLRWSTIQSPRILRAPAAKTPYPLSKPPILEKADRAVVSTTPQSEPSTSGGVPAMRRRGRPRKKTEEDVPRMTTATTTTMTTRRSLRSSKKKEIEEAVRETIEMLLEKVSERV